MDLGSCVLLFFIAIGITLAIIIIAAIIVAAAAWTGGTAAEFAAAVAAVLAEWWVGIAVSILGDLVLAYQACTAAPAAPPPPTLVQPPTLTGAILLGATVGLMGWSLTRRSRRKP